MKDSDSSEYDEGNTIEKFEEYKGLKQMSKEERIAEVLTHVLTETEVEYLIGNIRKNKTKRSIDDLSKIYIDAKHTFHVLMCKLG